MLAFNQSQHTLSFSTGGVKFSCEPWGSVDIPDEFWGACVRMGLPLDIASVPPEKRAQVRVADERKASDEAIVHALREQAEAAEAVSRNLRTELQAKISELSEVRSEAKKLTEERDGLKSQLARALSDKKTAEELLDAEAKRATDAETRVIKTEALLAERSKAQPKTEKRASAG